MPGTSGRGGSGGLLVDKRVGHRLCEARRSRDLEPRDVADGLGITVDHYLRYESGTLRLTPPELVRIAEYLGVTIGWFFKDAERSGHAKAPVADVRQTTIVTLADYRRARVKKNAGE
jgi:transcriptional regulator with XRE-family HTH domain